MAPDSPRALRLTFSYRDADIHLDSIRRLDMRARPSDAKQGHRDQVGFWVEVQDAAGQVIYRSVMRDPTRHEVETHAPDAGDHERHSHHHLDTVQGIFHVIIPDYGPQHTLAIFNCPELRGRIDYRKPPGPAREIARFALATIDPQ